MGISPPAALLQQIFEVDPLACPTCHGLEAKRRIRSTWLGGAQPMIVALTAEAMQGDRERCLEAGMDDYLSKPVRMEQVKGALARWMARQAA